jgi:hypothetical protein
MSSSLLDRCLEQRTSVLELVTDERNSYVLEVRRTSLLESKYVLIPENVVPHGVFLNTAANGCLSNALVESAGDVDCLFSSALMTLSILESLAVSFSRQSAYSCGRHSGRYWTRHGWKLPEKPGTKEADSGHAQPKQTESHDSLRSLSRGETVLAIRMYQQDCFAISSRKETQDM